MNRQNLKAKALQLRSEGKTFTEITQKLGVSLPRSTLSYWCSGVCLSSRGEERIGQLIRKQLKKARIRSVEVRRQRQRETVAMLFTNNLHLGKILADRDVAKIALAMLYLGEGSKWRSHRGLMLGSSDPNIITLYIALLKHCYGIPRRALRARVSYRADQDIRALERFWSKVTGIASANFYKTKPDPRTRATTTALKDYKGVCAVSCAGTKIQLELEQIAQVLAREMSIVIKGPIV
ncbi:MAG: hypothetical protein UY92_C0004G0003 [Candidatus Magasanikbacteria bacterium GW2011_GWA2_56_11]|uniref:Uncharacterized protein n=1 Tax=Candidatus Magasanikbacteria bacterium GW2011_GWA2_56_11 TaxID=1619044 RepID=A0A0G2AMY3_9BACT|nr:MAG: hypothetical protein UY92_C0004G0003 [Candidatus Magasanikbacteria bacterium GW2011_GWA2_56_11]